MRNFLQDLRYGMRIMLKRPGSRDVRAVCDSETDPRARTPAGYYRGWDRRGGVVCVDTFYREPVVWSDADRSAHVCDDRGSARIDCVARLFDSRYARAACRSDRGPAPHVKAK